MLHCKLNHSLPALKPARRRVFITGANGNIGSYIAEHGSKDYEFILGMRTLDNKEDVDRLKKYGKVVAPNLSNEKEIIEAFQGVDTVVHLAASASPETAWEDLLPNNIEITYHTMVAAKRAGCRRFIFASSIHAVSGYPVDMQVKSNDPVNPGDLYGVTKCFGEALGRYMAEKEGLSVIALRIGAFQPKGVAKMESSIPMLDAWLAPSDFLQMLKQCIEVESLQFGIFSAISDNRFKRLDINDAREILGYDPKYDFFTTNEGLDDLANSDVRAHNVTDKDQDSPLKK